jgi:hypothetical protein
MIKCPRCAASLQIPSTSGSSAKKSSGAFLLILLLAGAALGLYWRNHLPGTFPVRTNPPAPEATGNSQDTRNWDLVWNALLAMPRPDSIPPSARFAGPPLRSSDKVLFRFRPAPDIAKVYLAGSFNHWANNDNGKITDDRFAMRQDPSGIWYQWVELPAGAYSYQYITRGADGTEKWMRDPFVPAGDASGNTVLDFSKIASLESNVPSPGSHRHLAPLALPAPPPPRLNIRPAKAWVQPGTPNVLLVNTTPADAAGSRIDLQIQTPLGKTLYSGSQECAGGENRIAVPPIGHEGGFLARVNIVRGDQTIEQGVAILSVVSNIANDLRYGFYSNYPASGGDYSAKAAMLADLEVNAVEFYDYFPAHGNYSPRQSRYRSEPFGVDIDAGDARRKIAADRDCNIMSLAYVAAYAAANSVYQKYPYPMTDERGVPKIFNGQIMPEDEADRQHKPKWFHLMNIADGSPWQTYILEEFRTCLEEGGDHLLSFDGFEIDTYGDPPGAIFHASGSRSDGEPLSQVLKKFVGKVQGITHAVKPYGLVSFNSVNEFGIEQMHGVTDFLFLEIWRSYADRLDQIVDICFRDREPNQERVILKIYPADMDPARNRWPASTLRRLLGAAMTGGGSLMVAGEPDEKTGQMHALNTLYYPDNQPMSTENEDILRAYYRHDAMLFSYTHGQDVFNTGIDCPLPGCITRTFAAYAKRCLVIEFLRTGPDERWTTETPTPAPGTNSEVALSLPGGIAPEAVYFATPDVPALQIPARLDFDTTAGQLTTLLPALPVYGTLILQY